MPPLACCGVPGSVHPPVSPLPSIPSGSSSWPAPRRRRCPGSEMGAAGSKGQGESLPRVPGCVWRGQGHGVLGLAQGAVMWGPHHTCCSSSPWLCTCCPQLSSSSSLPAQPWVPQLQGLRSKLLPVRGRSGCLEPAAPKHTGQTPGATAAAGQQMAPGAAVWDPLPRPPPTPSPSDPPASALTSALLLPLLFPILSRAVMFANLEGRSSSSVTSGRSITHSCPPVPLPGHCHPSAHAWARLSPLLAQLWEPRGHRPGQGDTRWQQEAAPQHLRS